MTRTMTRALTRTLKRTLKRALKWSSHVVTVVLALLLIVTLYVAVSSRLSEGTPRVMGLNMYEALSGSMEPDIPTGSVILAKPNVDVNQLKVGDVITFQAPSTEYGTKEMTITHRIEKIVAKDGQLLFETKGDANDAPDTTLVPASNVVAHFKNLVIPYLGYYLNFMQTKIGIALLLMLPGSLLILSTTISLLRDAAKLDVDKTAEAGTKAESHRARKLNS